MSVGLVIRHTYQETCELCDKISQLVKRTFRSFFLFCERIGYARAAHYLATQGKYEEAKKLILERNNIK